MASKPSTFEYYIANVNINIYCLLLYLFVGCSVPKASDCEGQSPKFKSLTEPTVSTSFCHTQASKPLWIGEWSLTAGGGFNRQNCLQFFLMLKIL